MGGIATLSSKGQVTVPKDIRDFLALEQADKLIFTVINRDLIAVKPVKKSFLDFGGSVEPKEKPEDFGKIRSKVMRKIAESVVKRGK